MGYEGVYTATKKNGDTYYRASLTYQRKHISLGSYPTPQSAHEAYLEGRHILNSPELSLIHYHKSSPLPFEKWVCLTNFRDNGLYFGTPIYLRNRFFNYYLSNRHILKFDMDDLFYYASHKIMCRGNHYFVADYGMQVNIASRYGIKNYAVSGKDYCFRNGDCTDFRRENIEILNVYHGVSRVPASKGAPFYAARIHIRGNFLIGKYATEEEAAIAYNKAIDILHKNGVRKNYTSNYISGLPASQYAEIYSSVAISQKIIDYRP